MIIADNSIVITIIDGNNIMKCYHDHHDYDQ